MTTHYNAAGEPIAINYSALADDLLAALVPGAVESFLLGRRLSVLHQEVHEYDAKLIDGSGQVANRLLVSNQDRGVGFEVGRKCATLQPEPAHIHRYFRSTLLQLKLQVLKCLERLRGVFNRHKFSP